jgi:hypothetical protein
MSSTIHLQWKDAASASRFRTGVSLHSHTLYSRESLDFIYHAATRAPILSAAIRRGESVYRKIHGEPLDLARGWWTPPLGPHDAWSLEKSQIEALDRNAIVVDHRPRQYRSAGVAASPRRVPGNPDFSRVDGPVWTDVFPPRRTQSAALPSARAVGRDGRLSSKSRRGAVERDPDCAGIAPFGIAGFQPSAVG